MKLSEAKDNIIEVCDRMLDAKMVARSWGNVSSRIDENHFIITPSGRDYRSLSQDELVMVNISDGRSWGNIRPSSEMGIHLDAYRNNPEANFIIHTHQPEASVLSAFEWNIVGEEDDGEEFLRPIPCAKYGFPGSDELRQNVAEALEGGRYPMALMAHHGAICVGKGVSETVRLVAILEMMSAYQITQAFERCFGHPFTPEASIYAKILKEFYDTDIPPTYIPFYQSERQGNTILYYHPGGEKVILDLDHPALFMDQRVHQEIYRRRPDIGGILHSVAPAAVAYSLLEQPLGTYLDDFAQINGAEMQWAPLKEDAMVEALGDNHGVFLANNGALCCGKDLYDAESHLMVLEKNARSYLIGELFPEHPLKTLPREECEKMREFYLQSYSLRF